MFKYLALALGASAAVAACGGDDTSDSKSDDTSDTSGSSTSDTSDTSEGSAGSGSGSAGSGSGTAGSGSGSAGAASGGTTTCTAGSKSYYDVWYKVEECKSYYDCIIGYSKKQCSAAGANAAQCEDAITNAMKNAYCYPDSMQDIPESTWAQACSQAMTSVASTYGCN